MEIGEMLWLEEDKAAGKFKKWRENKGTGYYIEVLKNK